MNDLISRSALLEKRFKMHSNFLGNVPVVSVKDIETATAVDAVPVDENLGEMLNWAVRYALGRMSYAVSDTVGYVMPLIPKLDGRTLNAMRRDIALSSSYGMECDKADWMRLSHAIQEELERRDTHDE